MTNPTDAYRDEMIQKSQQKETVGHALGTVTECSLVDRLQAAYEWMREPDWADEFSLDDIVKWMDARPIAVLLKAKHAIETQNSVVAAPPTILSKLKDDWAKEEDRIDRLRLIAFKSNDPLDRQAYFDATSKWFQDRHYRRMASPADGER